MSYDIKHGPLVAERIKSWGLPEPLLAELEFRLIEDGARHLFAFRVAYSSDEQSLLLLDADFIAVLMVVMPADTRLLRTTP